MNGEACSIRQSFIALTKVAEQFGTSERYFYEVTNLSDLLIQTTNGRIGISALGLF